LLQCFGVQDIYLIEKKYTFQVNPKVVMGAAKWLSITQSKRMGWGTNETLKALKQKGYRICATSVLPEESISIEDLSIEHPLALVFGSEKEGISEEVQENCDARVHIPMVGFTESYNISVSVALALQHLMPRIKKSVSWQLSEEEREQLRGEWYFRSVKNAERLLKNLKKVKGQV
jgi:tRNA (guanosine-2'-O-)-methyltransferase